MNIRTALLGLFVALTVVFASTTVYEAGIKTTLTSTSVSTSTATNVTTETATSTSVSTQTETTTSVSTSRTFIALTTTQFPGMPWPNVIFVTTVNGSCSGICLSPNLSNAIVFICPNPISTATESCPFTFYSTGAGENMSIVVTYPVYNQTNELPVDNCEYDAHLLSSNTPVSPSPGYDYCYQVGSNAFVVAQEAPGPG